MIPKQPINNFFCIGAQKAGTSTLHDILKQHPDICLPKEKEAHFFDVNEYYQKGIDYYFKRYFDNYDEENLLGNINPNLQIENRSVQRILDHFGRESKFIFILRNPIERAYSHFLMSKKRGYETLSFGEAIKLEDERIEFPQFHEAYESEEPGHFEKNHLGYLRRSKYAKTLKFLYQKVPSENIKVFLFEDFVKNKPEVVRDLLLFLNVEPIQLNLDIISNKAEKAKIQKVSTFLNSSSQFKNMLKGFFPKKIRRVMKDYALSLNYRPLSKNEKTIPEEYVVLLKDHFEADILETERIIGKKTGYL